MTFSAIRFKSLWWWYISKTIVFLDITHHPVFYLKHNISETGFHLRLQVEPTQLEMEMEFSLQNIFLNKNRSMDNVQKHNSCIFSYIDTFYNRNFDEQINK
jgi:hypothetical protein